jgi:membrane protein required for colicin V production
MAIEGYDLVMIGLLAAAAVLGYFKGIVWQLAWIAGIAASSWVAIRFGGPLAPFFGQQAPWNKLIAMLALYLATSLAKGVLLCVVVTFFAITLAPGYRGQIVASRSGRLVAELIVRADQFLPREVIEAVDPFVRQFREQLAQPGGPGLATTQPTGGTTPARSFFDAVTSAAAWTGTEPSGQGTQQAAGQPAAQPATRAAWSQPAAPPHPASTAPPPAFPQQQSWPAATQRFQAPQQPVQQPAPPQPPARFPVGPQSPLPIR